MTEATEIETTLTEARDTLAALVRLQDEYDAVGWRVSTPRSAKLRHISLHLMDSTAKIAKIAERNDHREDEGEQVSDAELAAAVAEQGLLLAEIATHVLQLASLGNVDLAAALHDLYRRNARHFAPHSGFAELPAWVYEEDLAL